MTHQTTEIAYAAQRLFLSSVTTAVSHGISYITHLMGVSTPNQTIEETYVRYAEVKAEMDREDLINKVNDMTSGNRHDYLTRKDVEQIVDATLVAQGNVPEPDGPPAQPDDAMGTEDDLGEV